MQAIKWTAVQGDWQFPFSKLKILPATTKNSRKFLLLKPYIQIYLTGLGQKTAFWDGLHTLPRNISATEPNINNRKETRQSAATPLQKGLHAPKFGELWSTNSRERFASVCPPPKGCAQDKLQAPICDKFQFDRIHQMVDADAKSLVSVGEAVGWEG